MPYGIWIFSIAGVAGPIDSWLLDFDVDANEGRGGVKITKMPQHAMQFKSMADALAAYHKQSKVQPLRDDGKPNRPLTVYDAVIRRIP